MGMRAISSAVIHAPSASRNASWQRRESSPDTTSRDLAWRVAMSLAVRKLGVSTLIAQSIW